MAKPVKGEMSKMSIRICAVERWSGGWEMELEGHLLIPSTLRAAAYLLQDPARGRGGLR